MLDRQPCVLLEYGPGIEPGFRIDYLRPQPHKQFVVAAEDRQRVRSTYQAELANYELDLSVDTLARELGTEQISHAEERAYEQFSLLVVIEMIARTSVAISNADASGG
ncbi:MAG: hypothetical protein ABSG43_22870 [Solirubrobacteraceae bacterium]